MSETRSQSIRWVVVAMGDGYETHIVTGQEALERKFLEMHFGQTRAATDLTPGEVEQMESMLAGFRDEDNWVFNHDVGPVSFTQDNEDGNVYVYRLTDEVTP